MWLLNEDGLYNVSAYNAFHNIPLPSVVFRILLPSTFLTFFPRGEGDWNDGFDQGSEGIGVDADFVLSMGRLTESEEVEEVVKVDGGHHGGVHGDGKDAACKFPGPTQRKKL